MDILKITSEGLLWPKYLPKLDGAMICYKQGDPQALEDLAVLLSMLEDHPPHLSYERLADLERLTS